MKRLIWFGALIVAVGCTSTEPTLDGSSPEAWQASVEAAMVDLDEQERERFQLRLLQLSLEKTSQGEKTNEQILRELDGTKVSDLIR